MLLLTGVTGFFGEELLKKLAESKQKIRCFVRSSSDLPLLRRYGCEMVVGDVTEAVSVQKAVKGVMVVVHAAAVVGAEDAYDYEKVNVEGTRIVVEAAKRAGVKHFIFISSVLAAYRNTTPYGRSKLMAEEVVKKSGVPYTTLRISLIYKIGDDKAIGNLIGFIKKSPVVPLVGFGNNPLQPVYAEDAALAILNAVMKKPKNRTYYLAGPMVTYRNMVKAIALQLCLKRALLPVHPLLLKQFVAVYGLISRQRSIKKSQIDFLASNKAFSCEDAKTDLGFSPRPFQEGLRELLG